MLRRLTGFADTIFWGAEGRWHFASLGAARYTEEAEPLGQRVANDDPADAPPPVYETRVGGASDPEWQCRVPQEFYGGFQALPEHCQTSALRQLTKGLDEIYGFTPRKGESHPGRIVTVGPDRPHGPVGHGKADALRARALVSTARSRHPKPAAAMTPRSASARSPSKSKTRAPTRSNSTTRNSAATI